MHRLVYSSGVVAFGALRLVFAFDRAQNILSKFFGYTWNASFALGLSQLFRLHLVPRLVLKSRLKFVRQEPPGQKPVQGLTRLAAATNSNAGNSMAEVYPVPLEKAFLKVLLRTLKGRKSAPQRPRFLVRNRKSRHTPVYTESRLRIQIIDPRLRSEYPRLIRGPSAPSPKSLGLRCVQNGSSARREEGASRPTLRSCRSGSFAPVSKWGGAGWLFFCVARSAVMI